MKNMANPRAHIAPKKKEQQKMSLGAFLTDESRRRPGRLDPPERLLTRHRDGFLG
jgi:hypothetical protein